MNRATPHTLGAIASRFGLELRGGDPSLAIDGVDTLTKAGPTRIGFLANPRYRIQLADASAAAVVLRSGDRHYRKIAELEELDEDHDGIPDVFQQDGQGR